MSLTCLFFICSWVQSQLQDHSDELWEDGVQEYLTHASIIMVIFWSSLAIFYLFLLQKLLQTKEQTWL